MIDFRYILMYDLVMDSVARFVHSCQRASKTKFGKWGLCMDNKEVFSRQEVKDVLGCSISTVDSLIRSGRLKAIRLSPRRIVISRQALEAFLQEDAQHA